MVHNSLESRCEYWPTRSSICLSTHCSLICLLPPACFARALLCAHSFTHYLTPELVGKRFILMIWMPGFLTVLNLSAAADSQTSKCLTAETVCFSITEAFVCSCLTLWHPPEMPFFLHDLFLWHSFHKSPNIICLHYSASFVHQNIRGDGGD